MKKVYELEFFGRTLKVEVGELAKQANGAVLVRFNDTAVLSAAATDRTARQHYASPYRTEHLNQAVPVFFHRVPPAIRSIILL